MAKHFFHGKRRGWIGALSVALCASFSLGLFAACGGVEDVPDETPDDSSEETSATDTQLLRNGNFEFYTERETEFKNKRALISSPTSWAFRAGSPSSLTESGVIEADEWEELATSKYRVAPDGAEESSTAAELTDAVKQDAEAHWDEMTVYDRLLFYKAYGVDSAEEFSLYDDYKYSIEFEDVRYLAEDLGENGLTLHDGVKENENAVLMIHNKRSSDHVMGTSQYYSSNTTITLEAGTAAEITVWVRTDKLYHWYDQTTTEEAGGEKEEVKSRGGAYVAVENTVGGTSLSPMQITNINTKGAWEQYTVYVRANTYAATSFRLQLGLGQESSSSYRYKAVDGYAFFDDVTVKKISAADYETAVEENVATSSRCDLNSLQEDKVFDRDVVKETAFALDLLSDSFESLTLSQIADGLDVGLTAEEVSLHTTYYSFVKDNRTSGVKEGEGTDTPADPDKQSIVGAMTYGQIREASRENGYLKNVFQNDFTGKFPFGGEDRDGVPVLLMLSTNGAAYTAKLENKDLFTVDANGRLLVSFFAKTSAIRSGRLGAGVTLVDGENKTQIASFDTTKTDPVNIDDSDESLTDIYKGWVQCFFIVANDTDTPKTFSLNFTYGPTSVQGTTADNYCEGYAAFTDFKTMPLDKTQYSYASTGTYAQKVSLTAYAENTTKFDSAEASSDIENTLATPASFRGVLAGSKIFDQDGAPNKMPEGVYAGLLNKKYAANYMNKGEAWSDLLDKTAGTSADGDAWWNSLFGEKANNGAYEAQQPLVLLNTNGTATPSYGFISRSMTTTVSANSSQRITMRVKTAPGTTAYIYLIDASDTKTSLDKILAPELPAVTYWYDDDGNILRCDPESDDFDKKKDILFYLNKNNGLYTAASDANEETLYANLSNYKKDDDGNLITSDKTIAFYYNKENGKYYGYCDADGNYTQEVSNLPTTDENGASILRYAAPESTAQYESVIKVEGKETTKDNWTTVNFYVRTNSAAKTYRIEIWAGDRTNAKDGFPAGGYVFLDGYSAGSITNYTDLRDGAVSSLLETEANRLEGDEEKVNGSLGLYYTFSFYDSLSYLRHDRDHDGVDYYKWDNYTQSSYKEGLVWLKVDDADGLLFGSEEIPANPSYSVYLDYTPIDVSVTAFEPDDTGTDDAEDEETPPAETNIWLVLSSSVLAIVTVIAVVAVIVRAIGKKAKRNGNPVKVKKEKKTKPAPVQAPEAEPAEQDENDPYND